MTSFLAPAAGWEADGAVIGEEGYWDCVLNLPVRRGRKATAPAQLGKGRRWPTATVPGAAPRPRQKQTNKPKISEEAAGTVPKSPGDAGRASGSSVGRLLS